MRKQVDVKFLGAAQSVTGSMHLINVNGNKILLDCGLFQGHRSESNKKNRKFPFDPKTIDAVLLSHAHIDHSGNLPSLVKQGFQGVIYATSATRDLCSAMLMDSAYIQEKDSEYLNRKHKKRGIPPVEPIYTPQDVLNTLSIFQGIPYQKTVEILDGVNVQFFDAGHILGSAGIRLTIKENRKTVKFGYSGDIGRKNMPIIRDPEFIGDVDYLIMESTYGDVLHDPPEKMEKVLGAIIKSAFKKRGKIIIPAFSVGRTQDIVYTLYRLFQNKKIPKIPIFVDSPLSVNITGIYKLHPECFDDETAEYILQYRDPFGFNQLNYIQSTKESKALNERRGTYVIISASGMCEAGRILHHLSNNIEDSRNTILFVGFTAEHTLGRKIVEKNPQVKIFDKIHNLRSDVIVLDSFSAHADSNELFSYAARFNKKLLKNIFIVHGETRRSEYLRKRIKNIGYKSVLIPKPGEIFKLKNQ